MVRTTLQEAKRRAVDEIVSGSTKGEDVLDVLVTSLETATALRFRLTALEEASRTLLVVTCGGMDDRQAIEAARELLGDVLDAEWPQAESGAGRDASRYVALKSRSTCWGLVEDDDTQPLQLPVCGACLREIRDDESSTEVVGSEWCVECVEDEKNIRRGEEEMQGRAGRGR